jgi:hypothetical protein
MFNFLRESRDAGPVVGLPWLDDEQASLKVGTTRVFTLMNVTIVSNAL